MRRLFLRLLGLLAACGPASSGETEGGATAETAAGQTAATMAGSVPTTSTSTDAVTSTSATTDASTTLATTTAVDPGDDGLADYGPCPKGDECDRCVQSEGASICGPQCLEYGPGWATERCPNSPFQLQTICPLTDEVPGVCLITCGEVSDCPDPGMLCVTCPEPFKSACDGLWGSAEKGPNICAWPAT